MCGDGGGGGGDTPPQNAFSSAALQPATSSAPQNCGRRKRRTRKFPRPLAAQASTAAQARRRTRRRRRRRRSFGGARGRGRSNCHEKPHRHAEDDRGGPRAPRRSRSIPSSASWMCAAASWTSHAPRAVADADVPASIVAFTAADPGAPLASRRVLKPLAGALGATSRLPSCARAHWARARQTGVRGALDRASHRPSAMAASATKRKEIYTYTAPWLIYGMNWSVRADQRFRLAIGSFEVRPRAARRPRRARAPHTRRPIFLTPRPCPALRAPTHLHRRSTPTRCA